MADCKGYESRFDEGSQDMERWHGGRGVVELGFVHRRVSCQFHTSAESGSEASNYVKEKLGGSRLEMMWDALPSGILVCQLS